MGSVLSGCEKISDTYYALERKGRCPYLLIYEHNLMKRYVGEVHKVNLALNSTDELMPEIPGLVEFGRSMEATDVMKAAAPNEGLTESQKVDLHNLSEHIKVFSENPGRTAVITHDSELTSDTTVKSRQCRLAPRKQEILQKEVDRMLELQLIERC